MLLSQDQCNYQADSLAEIGRIIRVQPRVTLSLPLGFVFHSFCRMAGAFEDKPMPNLSNHLYWSSCTADDRPSYGPV